MTNSFGNSMKVTNSKSHQLILIYKETNSQFQITLKHGNPYKCIEMVRFFNKNIKIKFYTKFYDLKVHL